MAEAYKAGLDEFEKVDKNFDDENVIAPTSEEQAAYVRKLDRRIMPVIFLIYMLSVLVSLSRNKRYHIICLTMLRNTGPVEFRQRTPGRS